MSAVEAVSLSRSYGARRALDHVSLSVGAGEIFALLGPNGGGKTTLFRILATLIAPSGGTFRIDGLSPATNLREIRRRLGVVFQSPSLDKKLTLLENLSLQGELYGLLRPVLRERSESLLERFGISDRKHELVETLSGGLARRLEIAKALLHSPRVLLLDEPSTGLDPGARRSLREHLQALAKEDGTTVLLTTHLFEEAEAADRIGILDRGRLLAEGSPSELKSTVGGDVLVLETREEDDSVRLAAEILERFGAGVGTVTTLGSSVRIERKHGHEFIPSLVQALPGRFCSVTLGAPSLEDVFVARTGHRFETDDIS